MVPYFLEVLRSVRILIILNTTDIKVDFIKAIDVKVPSVDVTSCDVTIVTHGRSQKKSVLFRHIRNRS